jgi:hypothetical protein
MDAVTFGPRRSLVVSNASRRAQAYRQRHHPANRSRIIMPRAQIVAVAGSLAGMEPEAVGRLKEVIEDAQGANASAKEIAARVEDEVPSASFLAPLLKDAGTPLAMWLTLLLTLIGVLLAHRQQQPAQPVITPEQVEEIVTRIEDELNVEPPDEPATEKPKPKAPQKKRGPRPPSGK